MIRYTCAKSVGLISKAIYYGSVWRSLFYRIGFIFCKIELVHRFNAPVFRQFVFKKKLRVQAAIIIIARKQYIKGWHECRRLGSCGAVTC